MLWETGVHDVTDIKVPLHKWALERVGEFDGLAGAEEKLVPDVFDRDHDAEFFGEGDGLFDFGGGAREGLGVADLFSDRAGHEQDGAGAVGFGVAQTVEEAVETDLAGGGIRIAEGFGPVGGDADTRDLEARGIAGGEHLGLIHGAGRFDARETGIAEQLEFFAQAEFFRRLAIERREHEALRIFALSFRRSGCGRCAGGRRLGRERRGERRGGGECGSGAEERTAIHGRRRGRTQT